MGRDDLASLPEGMIKEFMDAWRVQAQAGPIPSAPRIDPSAMARLAPHLMVLEASLSAGPGSFRARLVGVRHQDVSTVCHAGALLDRVDIAHAERARIAAETRQPVCWRAAGQRQATVGDFPYASDGVNVDRIVSVVAVG